MAQSLVIFEFVQFVVFTFLGISLLLCMAYILFENSFAKKDPNRRAYADFANAFCCFLGVCVLFLTWRFACFMWFQISGIWGLVCFLE